MKISRNAQLIIATIASLFAILAVIFFVIRGFGGGYGDGLGEEEFKKLQYQLKEQKYDISKIRLETNQGVDIQILKNGTLIRIDKNGKKTAILGFGKINQLLSSYTEDQLKELQGSQGNGDVLYVVTIETESGNSYTIEIADGDDVPDDLEDLVDDIIDIAEDVLDPTPFPSSNPTPEPTPSSSSSPTPTPSSVPTPTPIVSPTPTPNPGTQDLPVYMTADPFDCSDYSLFKDTVISNIICTPN